MSKKILLIDDDDATRTTLTLVLQQSGYQVVEASNGREGLEAAATNHPDLIITDIIMPEMNGMEMIKALREQEAFKTTPIAIMTTNESIEVLNSALAYGVRDYLSKSDAGPEAIVATAKSYLG